MKKQNIYAVLLTLGICILSRYLFNERPNYIEISILYFTIFNMLKP